MTLQLALNLQTIDRDRAALRDWLDQRIAMFSRMTLEQRYTFVLHEVEADFAHGLTCKGEVEHWKQRLEKIQKGDLNELISNPA
mgnify:CR=1 FL=1